MSTNDDISATAHTDIPVTAGYVAQYVWSDYGSHREIQLFADDSQRAGTVYDRTLDLEYPLDRWLAHRLPLIEDANREFNEKPLNVRQACEFLADQHAWFVREVERCKQHHQSQAERAEQAREVASYALSTRVTGRSILASIERQRNER